jgi:hypothetical protein
MKQTKSSMWALALAAKKTDMAGKMKPALQGGSNSLRANVKWGQDTTTGVVNPDRLK